MALSKQLQLFIERHRGDPTVTLEKFPTKRDNVTYLGMRATAGWVTTEQTCSQTHRGRTVALLNPPILVEVGTPVGSTEIQQKRHIRSTRPTTFGPEPTLMIAYRQIEHKKDVPDAIDALIDTRAAEHMVSTTFSGEVVLDALTNLLTVRSESQFGIAGYANLVVDLTLEHLNTLK